ncbi:MAG: methyltransferase [Candidatus Omnitrophica bacterium]|nr:methyltransferase [Candidatus Omnitrophota bacterium]
MRLLDRMAPRGFPFIRRRPWYQDLCDYYQVTPQQALELGTRRSGRRPNLPGSATTQPVKGKTFEEIWDAYPRQTPAEILRFYQEIGAWSAFRQVVFHRDHQFGFIAKTIRPGDRVCEYGAGVAPIGWYLVERFRGKPLDLTIVDVPSEHLTFGQWRLKRRMAELNSPVKLMVQEVLSDGLPLTDGYDVITILEVYEHLSNPLEVTQHLCGHLKPGGLLWENYIIHEDASGADLPVAQEQRPSVFRYLREQCELIIGGDPDAHGGQTRCWRRRKSVTSD